MLSFTLDATNVKAKLLDIASGLNDFSEPFNVAGEKMLQFYGVDVFEQQSVGGSAWRALATTTVDMRDKRRGYYAQPPIRTDKILIWTGRLQQGFKKTVSAFRMVIFNDVEYFQYHQQAGARPMLVLTSEVIDDVVQAVNAFVLKLINL